MSVTWDDTVSGGSKAPATWANDIIQAIKHRGQSFVISTDKYGDYYCDGTNDDVQFQAANDNLTSGGLVFIKKGTYSIGSSMIKSDSNVWFIGEGPSTILQFATGKTGDKYIFDVEGTAGTHKTNVGILNMKLVATEAQDHGILLKYVDDSLVSNVVVDHLTPAVSTDEGIVLSTDCSRNTLLNVKVTDFQAAHGIELIGQTVGHFVENNTIINPTVMDCLRGINFRQYVRYNTVIGGFLYSNVNGAYLYEGAHTNTLMGTLIKDNTGRGVYNEDSATNGYLGLQLINNLLGGIYCTHADADALRIQGCRITCPTGVEPITLHASSTDCIVTGNSLLGDTVSTLYPTANFVRDNYGYVTENVLANQTVNIAETALAHGLNSTPNVVQPYSLGNWSPAYQSKAPDATNIYLKADADGRTFDVHVAVVKV